MPCSAVTVQLVDVYIQRSHDFLYWLGLGRECDWVGIPCGGLLKCWYSRGLVPHPGFRVLSRSQR